MLPLVGQGGGVLVGRGRSSIAQWLVSPHVLVGWVAVPVLDGCLHVPPCYMALLGSPLRFAWGDVDGALW